MHACCIKHRFATYRLALQQQVSTERNGRNKFTMSGREICLRTGRNLIQNDSEPRVLE